MKATLDATKPHVLIVNGKKYRAKVFQVQGDEIEIYPLQTLAHAIGRKPPAVTAWEKNGEFPKPLFQISGTALQEKRRWYSRVQILNLHQAHNRFPFSAGKYHLRPLFFTLANLVFDEGEIIDVSQIPIKLGTTAHAKTAARGGTVSTGSGALATAGAGIRRTVTTETTAVGKRIASEPAKPLPSRQVAATVNARYAEAPARLTERAHQVTPGTRSPDETNQRYAASPDSRPSAKRLDYRRRPASRT
jgi:hypothetical protein